MRLVFLGSPPFATPVLTRLVESPHRPLAIVTQPARAQGRGRKVAESDVAALARAHGIELLEPQSVREPAVMARLAELAPDVFLVVSYGEILRPEFLALPRIVALNVHPSLLPRHRGATPIQAALLAGDEVTGVAIQKVVQELDAGDLLLLRETPIRPGETAGELAARLAEWSGELVLEALDALEAGTARYVPQDAARATRCRKIRKEDGRLDWSRPARELEGRVRAMNPWPGAATTLPGGGELQVWRARTVEGAGEPGTLLEAGPRLVVAAGTGALEVLEVQAPGKRPLPAAEFLRGARLAAGARLGPA
ncbi:MAG TPA: methionyl-tRNA formyltransferase [Planctomycetota bacterium]